MVLLDARGRRWLVPVDQGVVKVRGLGSVKTDGLGRLVGRRLDLGGGPVTVLDPSLGDCVETLRRKAQIVGPKDSPAIVFHCDLRAGDVVVEGGAGSGALTTVLAHAVAPDGRVISYEERQDFLEVARENLERTELGDLVEFRRGDITQGIAERGVKAVVLDVPAPWEALPAAADALRPAGHLASFSPTVEQVRQTVLALREGGFVGVRTLEILERSWEVGRGTRPAFDMLGHTGYLTFARKAEAP